MYNYALISKKMLEVEKYSILKTTISESGKYLTWTHVLLSCGMFVHLIVLANCANHFNIALFSKKHLYAETDRREMLTMKNLPHTFTDGHKKMWKKLMNLK